MRVRIDRQVHLTNHVRAPAKTVLDRWWLARFNVLAIRNFLFPVRTRHRSQSAARNGAKAAESR
jgi:hypothetical protein